jgi:hypothetical protein
MRRFPAAILVLVLSSFCRADPVAAFKGALRRALDADAVWTMTKTVAGAPAGLKIEGSVSCAKGRGIIWQGERPFKSRISMLKDMMVFAGRGGERIVFSSDMSHYADVRSAIDGFLEGRDAPLGKLFEVSVSGNAAGWTVGLSPKRADVKMIVKSVSVSGGATVDRAEFRYASGETAVFEFRETGSGSHSLWKDGE